MERGDDGLAAIGDRLGQIVVLGDAKHTGHGGGVLGTGDWGEEVYYVVQQDLQVMRNPPTETTRLLFLAMTSGLHV